MIGVETSSPWSSLASTALGGVLALSGGLTAQWFASKARQSERREEFQRQTLLQLQYDLNKLRRAKIRGQDYGDEWRDVTIFMVRVEDDLLRELIERFRDEVRKDQRDAFDQTFEEINNRIGFYLRNSNYPPDTSNERPSCPTPL